MQDQINYLRNPEEQKEILLDNGSGPVFEPGPGWGQKTKRWLKKNFIKVVVPPLAIIILALGISSTSKAPSIPDEILSDSGLMKMGVEKGDGYATLARKALAAYLEENPDSKLSPGHKLFIEENLWRMVVGQPLIVGQDIKFEESDIELLIERSKALKPETLEKWGKYAEGVRFDF